MSKYRQDWRWGVHLQWFASHCQQIRQLLKANLTCGSEGWAWRQDGEEDHFITPNIRTWRYRYKLIRYEIGRTELVFHLSAFGKGYPARFVTIDIHRVGVVEHICTPGEGEQLKDSSQWTASNTAIFENNVNQLVEMAMLRVVSELTGENNEVYFK